MNYSRGLRLFRAILGISQQDLARKTNLSKSLISRIESGNRSFSKLNRQILTNKFNLPASLIELLSLDSEDSKFTENEIRKLGEAILKLSQLIEDGKKVPK